MQVLLNGKNGKIVKDIVRSIHENASLLSEIDGEIGDGDHGINMNKGFLLADKRISDDESFSEALKILGRTLVMDIGGSMGPIYGTMFSKMSKVFDGKEELTVLDLEIALHDAMNGVMELAGAQLGDKTLVDTIIPAYQGLKECIHRDMSFEDSLIIMKEEAIKGKESTKNMVAKLGRAARLGERSKGHLDAGATSCCIILNAMADSMIRELQKKE